jgi:beta-lactamase regulating signal transducer with metallopeptidase domain
MNDFITLAGQWLVQTAIGGGLLLLLVCVLMRFTRQPAKQQRLGEWGMAAALLLAAISLSGRPLFVVSWTQATPAPPPARTVDAMATVSPQPTTDAVMAINWTLPEDLSGAGPDADMEGPLAAEPAPNWQALWFQTGFTAGVSLFLACALLFAVRLVLGYIGLSRLLDRSREAPHDVRDVFESMAGDVLRARLLVTPRLPVPLSCGLVRPTVLLPAVLCKQPVMGTLRWIFAHELTHLRRRDAWSGLLFALGQVLFFYLPWFWALKRHVRLCQEYVADAVATEKEGQAVQYAEFLVSLADAPAVPAGATGVGGKSSDLYRRVSMLLDRPVAVQTGCTKRWTMFVGASLAALAVLLACVGYRAEAASDDTIVIIIRPDSGAPKPGQKAEVKVITIPGAQKKTGMSDAKAEYLLVVPDAAGANKQKTAILIDDVRSLDLNKMGISDDHLWALQAAGPDALEPLRRALKKLEELNKSGKLQNDAVKAELDKAMAAMAKKMPSAAAESLAEALLKAFAVVEADQGAEKAAAKRLLLNARIVGAMGNQKMDVKELGGRVSMLKELVVDQKALATMAKDLPAKIVVDLAVKDAQPTSKPRFGVQVEPVPETVAEHLGLAKGIGMLVQEVFPNTPAAKIGVQARDILLKIDGAMVPSDSEDFIKLIAGLKANTAFDVLIVRKGEKMKLENLKLAEAAPKTDDAQKLGERVEMLKLREKTRPDYTEALKILGKSIAEKNMRPPSDGGTANIVITQKVGNVTYALAGSGKSGGSFKVSEIKIQDGESTSVFNSVKAVPEQHRQAVSTLLERARASFQFNQTPQTPAVPPEGKNRDK